MSGARISRRKDFTGLLFAAFMFLGMGIGILFDRVAPGLFVGMGLGFLAMAIADVLIKEPMSEESQPSKLESHFEGVGIIGTFLLILLGIGFIFGGLSLILGIDIPWRVLGGAFIILLGLWFLLMALGKVKLMK
ncbi:MAG: hypothetical protein QW576_05760 [Candidatus Korarchaeum sp.]